MIIQNGRFPDKLSTIIEAYLRARQLRISSIAYEMDGKFETNKKYIKRFLNSFENPHEILPRLLLNDAEFVIGDPTKIERKEAFKTAYVGRIMPKMLGYYLLTYAAPLGGRAIPFHMQVYSPATFSMDNSSRNIEHTNSLAGITEVLQRIPVIFDREFSYGQLLNDFEQENAKFIIRLKTGNNVKLYDKNGNVIELSIGHGQTKSWHGLLYKNETLVNVAAKWSKGFKKPIFIITNTDDPVEAMELYFKRMKIEETFKDLKTYMGIDRNMSMKLDNLQKMLSIAFLAYAVSYFAGISLQKEYIIKEKWKFYSPLFVYLKAASLIGKVNIAKIHSMILLEFSIHIYPKICPHSSP